MNGFSPTIYTGRGISLIVGFVWVLVESYFVIFFLFICNKTSEAKVFSSTPNGFIDMKFLIFKFSILFFFLISLFKSPSVKTPFVWPFEFVITKKPNFFKFREKNAQIVKDYLTGLDNDDNVKPS